MMKRNVTVKYMVEEQPFTPLPTLILSDLDVVRALTDPLRLRIIEALIKEPRSVKNIAKEIGVGTTKLYYHIGQLEERGLIRVVDSRVVSGIIEKIYRAAALSYQIDRSLLSFFGDDAHSTDLEALLTMVFDATKEDVRRGVQAGTLPLNTPDRIPSLITRGNSSLSPERAREFMTRLRALLQEFSVDAPAQPDDTTYTLTIAFYPSVPAAQPDE